MVQILPNFWGQASTNFQDSYDRSQREKEAARVREQQQQQFQAQMLLQMFNQGGVNSSDLQSELAKSGLTVPIMPNQPERQREILGTPDVRGQSPILGHTGSTQLGIPPRPDQPGRETQKGWEKFSDDQLKAAGLPTRAERVKAQAGQATDELSIRKAEIIQRIASGGQASPEELEVAGMSSPQDKQLERIKGLQTPLTEMAKRHVSGLMATTKGRIDPNQMQQLSASAFDAFKNDRQMKMLNLTPDDELYARSFMSQAVMDAWMEQQKLDLDKERVRLQGVAASSRDNTPQMINALRGLADNVQRRINAMTQGGKGTILSQFIGMPEDQIPERYKSQVQELKTLGQALTTLQSAPSHLAPGSPEAMAYQYDAYQRLMGTMDNAEGQGARGTGAGPAGVDKATWEAFAKQFGEARARTRFGEKPAK